MKTVHYDDDPEFIKVIHNSLLELNKKHKGIFDDFKSFSNKQSIMEHVSSDTSPAIFLLDIVADGEPAGYAIAKHIKEHVKNSYIVYITDFPDIIIRNVKEKINSICFILKTSNEFNEELESVLLYAHDHLKSEYFVRKIVGREQKGLLQIKYDDIYYFVKIKGSRHIRVVHKGGSGLFLGTLSGLHASLSDDFCVSIREAIVNTKNIKHIDDENNLIHFDNGISCPFSRDYKRELLGKIKL